MAEGKFGLRARAGAALEAVLIFVCTVIEVLAVSVGCLMAIFCGGLYSGWAYANMAYVR